MDAMLVQRTAGGSYPGHDKVNPMGVPPEEQHEFRSWAWAMPLREFASKLRGNASQEHEKIGEPSDAPDHEVHELSDQLLAAINGDSLVRDDLYRDRSKLHLGLGSYAGHDRIAPDGTHPANQEIRRLGLWGNGVGDDMGTRTLTEAEAQAKKLDALKVSAANAWETISGKIMDICAPLIGIPDCDLVNRLADALPDSLGFDWELLSVEPSEGEDGHDCAFVVIENADGKMRNIRVDIDHAYDVNRAGSIKLEDDAGHTRTRDLGNVDGNAKWALEGTPHQHVAIDQPPRQPDRVLAEHSPER